MVQNHTPSEIAPDKPLEEASAEELHEDISEKAFAESVPLKMEYPKKLIV
jgi:hypothetical protein